MEFNREHQNVPPKQPHGYARLRTLAMNDPVIRAATDSYRCGAFPSWEHMLVDLVVTLAEQRNELLKQNLELSKYSERPALIMPTPPSP